MHYMNGLAKGEFLQHMFEEFPSVFNNPFSREMLENIVDYGTEEGRFCSMNSLYYFLSDMIPEIEPQDLLPYMDSNVLTDEVLGQGASNGIEPDATKKICSLNDLKDYLDANGWWVEECSFGQDRVGWEIGKHSPAGEDFFFSVEHGNDVEEAIDEIKRYAYDFDIDDHVEMWVEHRHSGRGVPDVQTLVEDAKAIQEMLDELADGMEYKEPDIDYSTANFLDDEEKMRDFVELSKEEFLASYSYLTETEYANTELLWREQQEKKLSLADQISGAAAKAETQGSIGHQNDKDHSI